jgi:proteasome lid subunit RPN8/RPN11
MLRLTNHVAERIKRHARLAYPDECCGFLFGTSDGDLKHASRLFELANASSRNRSRRFLIRPGEFRNAELWARGKSLEVVGLYHSHPDHPARPSQFDLDHALPWWSYVIISVEQGTPSMLTSWVLKDDRSEFVEEVVEGAGVTAVKMSGGVVE